MANEEAIVVVCRGSLPITPNPTNWITNFSFLSENVSHHFESDIPEDGEVWCHTGFWTAADSVYPRIRDCVLFLKAQSNRPVYLTGHSLGGALATILSMRLYTDGILPEENRLIVPRWFESDWAWVTPEDNNGQEDNEAQNLSDPRQVDFTYNEYDPCYDFDTDNRELLEKQNLTKLDMTEPLIYSSVKSPEELDKETDKLLYLYKEEPTTDQLKFPSDSTR